MYLNISGGPRTNCDQSTTSDVDLIISQVEAGETMRFAGGDKTIGIPFKEASLRSRSHLLSSLVVTWEIGGGNDKKLNAALKCKDALYTHVSGGGLRWAMLTSYKHHITQLLKVVQRRPVHPRVRVVCDCDSFSFQQYLLQYQEQALGLCCAKDTDFCRS